MIELVLLYRFRDIEEFMSTPLRSMTPIISTRVVEQPTQEKQERPPTKTSGATKPPKVRKGVQYNRKHMHGFPDVWVDDVRTRLAAFEAFALRDIAAGRGGYDKPFTQWMKNHPDLLMKKEQIAPCRRPQWVVYPMRYEAGKQIIAPPPKPKSPPQLKQVAARPVRLNDRDTSVPDFWDELAADMDKGQAQ